MTTALLALLTIGVWFTPPVGRWDRGPTPTEVALNTERARSADLKRQNDDLVARSRLPQPTTPDVETIAARDDLRQQLDDAEADLAKPQPVPPDKKLIAARDDLKRRLQEADAKLAAPRPPVVDPVERARADDLARQNAALNELIGRPRPLIEPPIVAALTKDEIVASRNLFGLFTQQSPFSFSEVDLVQGEVGRRANIIGYFQSWQDAFRADAIKAAWAHGQIPLMTWESQPQVGTISAEAPEYNLPAILAGNWDDYIRSYARGIRDLGLPVILRFDHEQNGTWYPWSEVQGWSGESINGNSRGQYAQMWRHVHDIFEAEDANQYTIWLWAPNRVNRIPSQPPPAEFYPGDQFVDWIGMSGYNRPYDDAPTFTESFGATLPLLRDAGSKPIFLAEIGATELGNHKADWIQSLFRGLTANPDVIGFAWFSLTVSSTFNGQRQTNDWRLNSSGASTRAMSEGLAATEYGLSP